MTMIRAFPKESQKICAICFDEKVDEDRLKQLKLKTCGHIFHENCIKTWFFINRGCPLCKTEDLQALANLSQRVKPLSEIKRWDTIQTTMNVNGARNWFGEVKWI